MDDASNARQLIGGPITDAGQLLLALVINELAGPDGWAVSYRKDLAKAVRVSVRTLQDSLKDMRQEGLLEERKKPFPGLRLTAKALSTDRQDLPVDRQELPMDRQNLPITDRQNLPMDRQELPTDRQNLPMQNASAYLPKRSKDLKEEDIAASPSSSSPPGELVLVADNPAPESPRLDQPAAQPPAIVEQGAQLPAKPKRKRKRKRAKSKRVALPDDWMPDQDTLDQCERVGIPRAFAEGTVWEFKRFWRANGKTMADWGGTFFNNAKRCWKKERENEQKSEQRQRYTDASGRPISEATRVMQDCHDNVLANAHLFADIDEDKPF